MPQMDKLNKAIELAREPGSCQYVTDGEPCCVIAQLYILEGGTVDELRQWRSTVISHVLYEVNPPQLASYPKDLLADLQYTWDAGCNDAETRREIMRQRVRKAASL